MKKQILQRGYITNALTNEKGEVFGMTIDCHISKWSNEGSNFYWSEVYCEPGNMTVIIRRGMLLCNCTDDKLSEYHEQSKVNLH